MNTFNKAALAKAIQYLRSRNKYIMDKSCVFQPTSSAATDVRKTWEAFKAERSNNVRRMK